MDDTNDENEEMTALKLVQCAFGSVKGLYFTRESFSEDDRELVNSFDKIVEELGNDIDWATNILSRCVRNENIWCDHDRKSLDVVLYGLLWRAENIDLSRGQVLALLAAARFASLSVRDMLIRFLCSKIELSLSLIEESSNSTIMNAAEQFVELVRNLGTFVNIHTDCNLSFLKDYETSQAVEILKLPVLLQDMSAKDIDFKYFGYPPKTPFSLRESLTPLCVRILTYLGGNGEENSHTYKRLVDAVEELVLIALAALTSATASPHDDSVITDLLRNTNFDLVLSIRTINYLFEHSYVDTEKRFEKQIEYLSARMPLTECLASSSTVPKRRVIVALEIMQTILASTSTRKRYETLVSSDQNPEAWIHLLVSYFDESHSELHSIATKCVATMLQNAKFENFKPLLITNEFLGYLVTSPASLTNLVATGQLGNAAEWFLVRALTNSSLDDSGALPLAISKARVEVLRSLLELRQLRRADGNLDDSLILSFVRTCCACGIQADADTTDSLRCLLLDIYSEMSQSNQLSTLRLLSRSVQCAADSHVKLQFLELMQDFVEFSVQNWFQVRENTGSLISQDSIHALMENITPVLFSITKQIAILSCPIELHIQILSITVRILSDIWSMFPDTNPFDVTNAGTWAASMLYLLSDKDEPVRDSGRFVEWLHCTKIIPIDNNELCASVAIGCAQAYLTSPVRLSTMPSKHLRDVIHILAETLALWHAKFAQFATGAFATPNASNLILHGAHREDFVNVINHLFPDELELFTEINNFEPATESTLLPEDEFVNEVLRYPVLLCESAFAMIKLGAYSIQKLLVVLQLLMEEANSRDGDDEYFIPLRPEIGARVELYSMFASRIDAIHKIFKPGRYGWESIKSSLREMVLFVEAWKTASTNEVQAVIESFLSNWMKSLQGEFAEVINSEDEDVVFLLKRVYNSLMFFFGACTVSNDFSNNIMAFVCETASRVAENHLMLLEPIQECPRFYEVWLRGFLLVYYSSRTANHFLTLTLRVESLHNYVAFTDSLQKVNDELIIEDYPSFHRLFEAVQQYGKVESAIMLATTVLNRLCASHTNSKANLEIVELCISAINSLVNTEMSDTGNPFIEDLSREHHSVDYFKSNLVTTAEFMDSRRISISSADGCSFDGENGVDDHSMPDDNTAAPGALGLLESEKEMLSTTPPRKKISDIMSPRHDPGTTGDFAESDEDGVETMDLADDGGDGTEDDPLPADNSGQCTFLRTGDKYEDQHWYHCMTCSLVNEKGCCGVCAQQCHAGHDITYARRSRFFCDCGAEGKCVSKKITKKAGASQTVKQVANAEMEWNLDRLFRTATSTIGKMPERTSQILKKYQVLETLGRTFEWFTNQRIVESSSTRNHFIERCRTVESLFHIRPMRASPGIMDARPAQLRKIMAIDSHGHLFIAEGSTIRCMSVGAFLCDGAKNAEGDTFGTNIRVPESALLPLYRMTLNFFVHQVEFNPWYEYFVALVGDARCLVLTLSDRGSVVSKTQIELALSVSQAGLSEPATILGVQWIGHSATHLLVVTTNWAKVYDLSVDHVSPFRYYEFNSRILNFACGTWRIKDSSEIRLLVELANGNMMIQSISMNDVSREQTHQIEQPWLSKSGPKVRISSLHFFPGVVVSHPILLISCVRGSSSITIYVELDEDCLNVCGWSNSADQGTSSMWCDVMTSIDESGESIFGVVGANSNSVSYTYPLDNAALTTHDMHIVSPSPKRASMGSNTIAAICVWPPLWSKQPHIVYEVDYGRSYFSNIKDVSNSSYDSNRYSMFPFSGLSYNSVLVLSESGQLIRMSASQHLESERAVAMSIAKELPAPQSFIFEDLVNVTNHKILASSFSWSGSILRVLGSAQRAAGQWHPSKINCNGSKFHISGALCSPLYVLTALRIHVGLRVSHRTVVSIEIEPLGRRIDVPLTQPNSYRWIDVPLTPNEVLCSLPDRSINIRVFTELPSTFFIIDNCEAYAMSSQSRAWQLFIAPAVSALQLPDFADPPECQDIEKNLQKSFVGTLDIFSQLLNRLNPADIGESWNETLWFILLERVVFQGNCSKEPALILEILNRGNFKEDRKTAGLLGCLSQLLEYIRRYQHNSSKLSIAKLIQCLKFLKYVMTKEPFLFVSWLGRESLANVSKTIFDCISAKLKSIIAGCVDFSVSLLYSIQYLISLSIFVIYESCCWLHVLGNAESPQIFVGQTSDFLIQSCVPVQSFALKSINSLLKSKKKTTTISSDDVIHYKCDICGKYPLQICRWHCTVCEDFDLCADCRQMDHAKHKRSHVLKPMRTSDTTFFNSCVVERFVAKLNEIAHPNNDDDVSLLVCVVKLLSHHVNHGSVTHSFSSHFMEYMDRIATADELSAIWSKPMFSESPSLHFLPLFLMGLRFANTLISSEAEKSMVNITSDFLTTFGTKVKTLIQMIPTCYAHVSQSNSTEDYASDRNALKPTIDLTNNSFCAMLRHWVFLFPREDIATARGDMHLLFSNSLKPRKGHILNRVMLVALNLMGRLVNDVPFSLCSGLFGVLVKLRYEFPLTVFRDPIDRLLDRMCNKYTNFSSYRSVQHFEYALSVIREASVPDSKYSQRSWTSALLLADSSVEYPRICSVYDALKDLGEKVNKNREVWCKYCCKKIYPYEVLCAILPQLSEQGAEITLKLLAGGLPPVSDSACFGGESDMERVQTLVTSLLQLLVEELLVRSKHLQIRLHAAVLWRRFFCCLPALRTMMLSKLISTFCTPILFRIEITQLISLLHDFMDDQQRQKVIDQLEKSMKGCLHKIGLEHTRSRQFSALADCSTKSESLTGYLLPSALSAEPCNSCRLPQPSFRTLSLKDQMHDIKFTSNSMFVNLDQLYTINSVSVEVMSLIKGQGSGVKSIRVYVSCMSVSEVASLLDEAMLPYWTHICTLQLPSNMVNGTASEQLPIPVIVANMKFVYETSAERLFSQAAERQTCPRCSNFVSDTSGVCKCGEIVYQCRHCRRINQEDRNALLCVDCGNCKYAKFDHKMTACIAIDYPHILSDAEFVLARKYLVTLQNMASNGSGSLDGLRRSWNKGTVALWDRIGSSGICNAVEIHDRVKRRRMSSADGNVTTGSHRHKGGAHVVDNSDLFLQSKLFDGNMVENLEICLGRVVVPVTEGIKVRSDSAEESVSSAVEGDRSSDIIQSSRLKKFINEHFRKKLSGGSNVVFSRSGRKGGRKPRSKSNASALGSKRSCEIDVHLNDLVSTLPESYGNSLFQLISKQVVLTYAIASVKQQIIQYQKGRASAIVNQNHDRNANDICSSLEYVGDRCRSCQEELFSASCELVHAMSNVRLVPVLLQRGISLKRDRDLDYVGQTLLRLSNDEGVRHEIYKHFNLICSHASEESLRHGNWLAGTVKLLEEIVKRGHMDTLDFLLEFVQSNWSKLGTSHLLVEAIVSPTARCLAYSCSASAECSSLARRNLLGKLNTFQYFDITAKFQWYSSFQIRSVCRLQRMWRSRQIRASPPNPQRRPKLRSIMWIVDALVNGHESLRAWIADFLVELFQPSSWCLVDLVDGLSHVFVSQYNSNHTASYPLNLADTYMQLCEKYLKKLRNVGCVTRFQIQISAIMREESIRISNLDLKILEHVQGDAIQIPYAFEMRWLQSCSLLMNRLFPWKSLSTYFAGSSFHANISESLARVRAMSVFRGNLLSEVAATMEALANATIVNASEDEEKRCYSEIAGVMRDTIAELKKEASTIFRRFYRFRCLKYLLEGVSHMILPVEQIPDIQMRLSRARTQEEFFSSSLERNHWSLEEIANTEDEAKEPTMRDLRTKIASDLGMKSAEEVFELLVANKIINIDLPVRLVYEKVWKPFQLANEASSTVKKTTTSATHRDPPRGQPQLVFLHSSQGNNRITVADDEEDDEDNQMEEDDEEEEEEEEEEEDDEDEEGGDDEDEETANMLYGELSGYDNEFGIVEIDKHEEMEEADERMDSPMEIVYRLQGIDGEATEDIVQSLEDNKKEELPEVTYSKSLFFGIDGLGACLDVIQTIESEYDFSSTTIRDVFTNLLVVIEQCCNCSANRKLLLDLNAIPVLLKAMIASMHFMKVERLITILELLLTELGNCKERDYQYDMLGILLEHLDLHKGSPRLNYAMSRMLPFLTFGKKSHIETLLQRFSVSLENGDYESMLWSMDAMGTDHNSHALRSVALEVGFTQSIGSALMERWKALSVPMTEDMSPKQMLTAMQSSRTELAAKDETPIELRILTGLCKGHTDTQSYLHTSGVIEVAFELEQVPTQIGQFAENLLQAVVLENDTTSTHLTELKSQRTALKKRVQMMQKKAIVAKLQTKKRKSSTGEVAAHSKKTKVSTTSSATGGTWLDDMNAMEDETGHTCAVCREGYKIKPSELLAVYVFTKQVMVDSWVPLVNLEGIVTPPLARVGFDRRYPDRAAQLTKTLGIGKFETQIPAFFRFLASLGVLVVTNDKEKIRVPLTSTNRKQTAVTSVSSFNCIHTRCHDQAVLHDKSHPRAPKEEWEGAELRNGQVKCNNMLPIQGPSVNSQSFISGVDKYFAQLGTSRLSRLSLVLYDMRSLTRRLTFEESLSADTNGGGIESNFRLMVSMARLSLYIMQQCNEPVKVAHEAILFHFLAQNVADVYGTIAYDSATENAESDTVEQYSRIDVLICCLIAFVCCDYEEWQSMRLLILNGILKEASYFQDLIAKNKIEGVGSGALRASTCREVLKPLLVAYGLIEFMFSKKKSNFDQWVNEELADVHVLTSIQKEFTERLQCESDLGCLVTKIGFDDDEISYFNANRPK